MMMKKLSVLALALLMAGGAMAQVQKVSRWYDYDRGNYVGVRVGVSASQLFLHGVGNATAFTRPGWDAAIVVGQRLGEAWVPLFIEGGVHFVQKQVRANWTEDIAARPLRMEIGRNYLELPVVFKYKFDVGVDDMTIQPFFGGFVAMGVGGETRVYPGAVEERYKIDTFSRSFLRRVDAGLRVGCGYAFQNLYFEAAYDIGLANIGRSRCRYLGYDSFDNSIRTGSFMATLGFDF